MNEKILRWMDYKSAKRLLIPGREYMICYNNWDRTDSLDMPFHTYIVKIARFTTPDMRNMSKQICLFQTEGWFANDDGVRVDVPDQVAEIPFPDPAKKEN